MKYNQCLLSFALVLALASSAFAATPPVKKSPQPICHEIKTCRGQRCESIRLCENQGHFRQKLDAALTAIAPDHTSVLEQRVHHEKAIESSPYGLAFDEPNYVLPVYFTFSPYDSVYAGQTPDNQPIKSEEFKAQLSFKWPIWQHVLGTNMNLGLNYTQLFFWQLYTNSPYFRETNYQPAVTLSSNFHQNWMAIFGLVHESNGRGGSMERSWNRIYVDLGVSGTDWYFSVKPWMPVFKAQSSDHHNPDITRYLGHGRWLLAVQTRYGQVAFTERNGLESGFKRGAYELTYSHPIPRTKMRVYLQAFSGYGQSLIEYNHRTNAVGVVIAFNDWIITPNQHLRK
jgi:phospholipase A1